MSNKRKTKGSDFDNSENSITTLEEKIILKLKDHIKLLIKEEVDNAIDKYKVENESLKAEVIELKASQEFICSKYDTLKAEYDSLEKNSKQQKAEISQLANDSSILAKMAFNESSKLDNIEQYGRRQNLEFKGVPLSEGENTSKIITDLIKLLNIDIKQNDISTSHRLHSKYNQNSTKNQDPPVIIARFINRDIRNEIYSKRKLASNISAENFPIKGMRKLFINENLTQHRKKLLWITKKRAKENHFKHVWTNNGKILARKTDDSAVLIINDENELYKLS